MTKAINGFIDLHTHGIGRYDTRSGNPDHILKAAELHGKAGTGAILPTIYPGPINEMREGMGAVRKAMEAQRAGKRKSNPPLPPFARGGANHFSPLTFHPAFILGVHLEGPFLNPDKCGALDRNSFIAPSIPILKELIAGYEDIIRIMTVAPEMPGALKIIERCSGAGIRVNMGHSDATYKQAGAGKKAGAGGVTHIFNAMKPFDHREPGLAGLGLLDEDLYIEVIPDGFHLHPVTLELIFNLKRPDRIILVSDSVKGGGKKSGAVPGPPVYDKRGILSGSGITISDSLRVLRNIGIPEAEIIRAATDNPARYIRSL